MPDTLFVRLNKLSGIGLTPRFLIPAKRVYRPGTNSPWILASQQRARARPAGPRLRTVRFYIGRWRC
jgi:hypothetical protein